MNLKEEYMDSGFVWQPSGNFACPLDNFQSVLSPSWVQNAFQLNLTSAKDHRYPALINCVARKQTSRIYRFEILSCCKESDFLLIRKLASNNGNVNITMSLSNKKGFILVSLESQTFSKFIPKIVLSVTRQKFTRIEW